MYLLGLSEIGNAGLSWGHILQKQNKKNAEQREKENLTQKQYLKEIFKIYITFYFECAQEVERELILKENNDNSYNTHSQKNSVQAYKKKLEVRHYSNVFKLSDLSIFESV